MEFDNALLAHLQQGDFPYFYRSYTWKDRGITAPHSVLVPEMLRDVDQSPRITGGGIVFHCPGDTVFSMGFLVGDSRFPNRFKDKLAVISEWFGKQLAEEGFSTTTQDSPINRVERMYCSAYPNPFERYFESQKVVAFSMKRQKDVFMVQGIVHRGGTGLHFQEFESEFGQYFTKGLLEN